MNMVQNMLNVVLTVVPNKQEIGANSVCGISFAVNILCKKKNVYKFGARIHRLTVRQIHNLHNFGVKLNCLVSENGRFNYNCCVHVCCFMCGRKHITISYNCQFFKELRHL